MDKRESREDYLEAILQLSSEGHHPKSIEIAGKLGFTKPSVSVAVKKLKNDNLIVVDETGRIFLTDEGRNIAEHTLEKHKYLTAFFIKIGVNEIDAEEQACKIEHDIDQITFEKLKEFLDK